MRRWEAILKSGLLVALNAALGAVIVSIFGGHLAAWLAGGLWAAHYYRFRDEAPGGAGDGTA